MLAMLWDMINRSAAQTDTQRKAHPFHTDMYTAHGACHSEGSTRLFRPSLCVGERNLNIFYRSSWGPQAAHPQMDKYSTWAQPFDVDGCPHDDLALIQF